MSYTEYLRRKAAATPTIISTRKTVDASLLIAEKRLATAQIFARDGRQTGVINNSIDPSSPLYANRSYQKATGGQIPDASSFTASSATGAGFHKPELKIQSCCTTLIDAPVPDKIASSFTTGLVSCHEQRGEHEIPSVFVDDTISLNGVVGCERAIFDVKAKTAFPKYPNRPDYFANKYVDTTPVGQFRKVGAPIPSDHLPYVEKHHGNDLNVNPRRPFVPYQIPFGVIPHLKINDPKFGNVKF